MSHILVVEDDPEIAASVVRGLRDAGHSVVLETQGDAGAERGLRERFDFVILDVNLPGKSGFEILEQWKGRLSVPVLVLTARVGLEDRLEAFEGGAVDFVAKPFFLEEVLARIRTRLALAQPLPTKRFSWSDVVVDADSREVTAGGAPVSLTPHEFNVLLYLVERPGRAIARTQIASAVLSADGETSERTVDSHLARLRKKLGADAAAALQTVWGIGYRFSPPDAASTKEDGGSSRPTGSAR